MNVCGTFVEEKSALLPLVITPSIAGGDSFELTRADDLEPHARWLFALSPYLVIPLVRMVANLDAHERLSTPVLGRFTVPEQGFRWL
jgi:hypothetical protein